MNEFLEQSSPPFCISGIDLAEGFKDRDAKLDLSFLLGTS